MTTAFYFANIMIEVTHHRLTLFFVLADGNDEFHAGFARCRQYLWHQFAADVATTALHQPQRPAETGPNSLHANPAPTRVLAAALHHRQQRASVARPVPPGPVVRHPRKGQQSSIGHLLTRIYFEGNTSIFLMVNSPVGSFCGKWRHENTLNF